MQSHMCEYESRRAHSGASGPIDLSDAREVVPLADFRDRNIDGLFCEIWIRSASETRSTDNLFVLGLAGLLVPDAPIVHCRRGAIVACS